MKASSSNLLTLLAAAALACAAFGCGGVRAPIATRPEGKPAGRIAAAEGEVKQKYASANDWIAAQTEASVYNDDRIRTGDKSSAVLNLGDDSRIKLSENAMLFVKAKSLQLESGVINVELDADQSDLTIQAGDTIIRQKRRIEFMDYGRTPPAEENAEAPAQGLKAEGENE